ncbi:MAG: TonB-dependent receptor plug domain-containing protein [Gemmatimonadaceae bacterium]
MMRFRLRTRRVSRARSALVLLAVTVVGCRPLPQVESGRLAEPATVNVGYGTAERSRITSAIASIDSAAIERRQVQSLAEALRGLPGVEVIGSGASARVRVRGTQSFLVNDDPLYVIDGTPAPFGSAHVLIGINPHDVARIDILKDAGAAIYGARGANGVVLITTKRPG